MRIYSENLWKLRQIILETQTTADVFVSVSIDAKHKPEAAEEKTFQNSTRKKNKLSKISDFRIKFHFSG